MLNESQFVMPCLGILTVPETFCPILLAALEDHVAAVRACAISSFGSFLKHDWVDLLLSNADSVKGQHYIDWAPLECILSLCAVNEEKNANVRSSSCKAVGDICTACIGDTFREEKDDTQDESFSDGFVLAFTCKICEAMINSLTDENASVRSMVSLTVADVPMIQTFVSSSFFSCSLFYARLCMPSEIRHLR